MLRGWLPNTCRMGEQMSFSVQIRDADNGSAFGDDDEDFRPPPANGRRGRGGRLVGRGRRGGEADMSDDEGDSGRRGRGRRGGRYRDDDEDEEDEVSERCIAVECFWHVFVVGNIISQIWQ